MKTVIDKPEPKEHLTLPYPYSMEDNNTITFEIMGQTPDMSIEDRSVFLSMSTQNNDNHLDMWMNGEDAITLGQKLIKCGTFALEANMINHQQRFMKESLLSYIREDRVEKLVYKNVDDNPKNYGSSYHTFAVTPIWKAEKAPKFAEDFSYEEVVHFSPFEDEYCEQISYRTLDKCEIEFDNYDYLKEVAEFNKQCEEMV